MSWERPLVSYLEAVTHWKRATRGPLIVTEYDDFCVVEDEHVPGIEGEAPVPPRVSLMLQIRPGGPPRAYAPDAALFADAPRLVRTALVLWAVVEGSTVPPSDFVFERHHAAGGSWRVALRRPFYQVKDLSAGVATLRRYRDKHLVERWWCLDIRGLLCPRPRDASRDRER